MSDIIAGDHATGAPGAVPPRTDGDGGADQQDQKTFTQAELDAIIEQRLKRQRSAMEAQQREAQQALEVQKLEDQKEFEKLAKQRADEIKNLKPRADLAETYEKSVRVLLTEMTKDLPSNIQMLLDKLPLPDQIDWLTVNAASVKAPPVATGNTDINAWTRQRGTPGLTDEEYLEKKRRSGIYS